MLRVKKPTSEKYAYALDGDDARKVKAVGILGFVSTVFILFGYVQFVHISVYIALSFVPVIVIILLYHFIQYGLLVFYPGFDAERHRQRVDDFWQQHQDKIVRRVAVFIPAAGESVAVVRETVRDAARIDYPNFKVFILDDSKDGMYKPLAKECNVYYVRRPNIGEFKKAGNMNYALGLIKSFQNILVLDADFRPRREILKEMVPYVDDETAIIQSPQHFALDKIAHSRSKIEYGAAYIQQDFYRVTQVARNRFGAAICVGTSALYSIEALKRVGGYEGVGRPKGWAHSEDVHTGLKMLNTFNSSDKQYRIRYLPVQLTKGTCPDDHYSFYKQQNRWATGSMQLLFSKMTVRSARLSIVQRIIYGSNSLYYFYTMSLLLSPLYLLALIISNNPSSWAFTLYFIPSLVFKHLIEPYVMRKQRAPIATSLVVISNAYTFLQALFLLIIKKPLGWEATGSKGGKKSRHFTNFKLIVSMSFILIYIFTLGALIMNERFQYGASIFIVLLFLASFFTHLIFLFYVLVIDPKRFPLLDRKFYAALVLIAVLGLVVSKAYIYHGR
ncbi:MAG TPA: glycosyltransferase, partial [Candidatus Saccharimonadales bacterium]|nr:glycosyltransferase [Candidatus Saccharimonadales bacterium]